MKILIDNYNKSAKEDICGLCNSVLLVDYNRIKVLL